jgi:hypothetical protein
MLRKPPKGVVKGETTHIFLIKKVEGARPSAAKRKEDENSVNNLVKSEGGRCRLYSTRTKGAPFDFVSVIAGVSAAAARRIAAEIDRPGTVKATIVSGVEVFSNP